MAWNSGYFWGAVVQCGANGGADDGGDGGGVVCYLLQSKSQHVESDSGLPVL